MSSMRTSSNADANDPAAAVSFAATPAGTSRTADPPPDVRLPLLVRESGVETRLRPPAAAATGDVAEPRRLRCRHGRRSAPRRQVVAVHAPTSKLDVASK